MRTCEICQFEGSTDEEVKRLDSNGDAVYGEQYDHGTTICSTCEERLNEAGALIEKLASL